MFGKWLMVWFFLATNLFAKVPVEIVSYYLSKESPKVQLAKFLSAHPISDKEPPSLDDLPRFEEAPFQSRFFKAGEHLFDVTALMKPAIWKPRSDFQAVLNETSGRLIVRASAWDQQQVQTICQDHDQAVFHHLELIVYEIPPAKTLSDHWNLTNLPKSSRKLKVIRSKATSGQSIKIKDQQITLAWEPRFGSLDFFGDIRWSIKGSVTVKERPIEFSYVSGHSLISGLPHLIDLGTYDSEGRGLILSQTVTSRLEDGTSRDDLMSPEFAKPPLHLRSEQEFLRYEDNWLRYRTLRDGKAVERWIVPSAFYQFISHDGLKGAQLDENLSEDSFEKAKKDSSDSIDVRRLLEKQGVNFNDEDFAILSPKGPTLFASASLESLELIDAIVQSGGPDIPRDHDVTILLIEAEEEPQDAELKKSFPKVLARLTTSARSGQNATTGISAEGHEHSLEVEAQIGARDDVIDLRLEGLINLAIPQPQTIQTGLTLKNGQPRIISKYRHGKNWRAIVVKATIRPLIKESSK